MSDPKYDELALSLKKLKSDVETLKAQQFTIDNNFSKATKDVLFLKDNVVNKANSSPTDKFLRGDRTWIDLSSKYAPLIHGITPPYIPYADTTTSWAKSPLSVITASTVINIDANYNFLFNTTGGYHNPASSGAIYWGLTSPTIGKYSAISVVNGSSFNLRSYGTDFVFTRARSYMSFVQEYNALTVSWDHITASVASINLSATTDVNIPTDIPLKFYNANNYIEYFSTKAYPFHPGMSSSYSALTNLYADTLILEGGYHNYGSTWGSETILLSTAGTLLSSSVGITLNTTHIYLTATSDIIIPTDIPLKFYDSNDYIKYTAVGTALNYGAFNHIFICSCENDSTGNFTIKAPRGCHVDEIHDIFKVVQNGFSDDMPHIAFPQYGAGLIHSDSSGNLTSSAIVNTDFGSLGTTNYLAKFDTTGLANSQIFDDGTNVHIGAAGSYNFFTVGGTSLFTDAAQINNALTVLVANSNYPTSGNISNGFIVQHSTANLVLNIGSYSHISTENMWIQSAYGPDSTPKGLLIQPNGGYVYIGKNTDPTTVLATSINLTAATGVNIPADIPLKFYSSSNYIKYVTATDEIDIYGSTKVSIGSTAGCVVLDNKIDFTSVGITVNPYVNTGVLILNPQGNYIGAGLNNTAPSATFDLLGTARFGDHTTNYSNFESDGTLHFTGSATIFDDINKSFASVKTSGTTVMDIVTIGGNNFNAFHGTTTTVQQGESTEEILHSYKEGSDITPHIHWMPEDTGSGNVKFSLGYRWANRTDVLPAETIITVTVAAGGVANQMMRTDFPVISGAGKTIGGRFIWRVFRDPADAADTYTGHAIALDFGLHFEKDTVGSRQITTK